MFRKRNNFLVVQTDKKKVYRIIRIIIIIIFINKYSNAFSRFRFIYLVVMLEYAVLYLWTLRCLFFNITVVYRNGQYDLSALHAAFITYLGHGHYNTIHENNNCGKRIILWEGFTMLKDIPLDIGYKNLQKYIFNIL